MSTILDAIPEEILNQNGITLKTFQSGGFINHPFFREPLSMGPRHMLATTSAGRYFMTGLSAFMCNTTITDMLLEYIKTENSKSVFGIFKSDDVLKIPGLKLTFIRGETEKDHRWKYEFTRGSVVKRDSYVDTIQAWDIGWTGLFAREQMEKLPDHPILDLIRTMIANDSEKTAEAIIVNFHKNLHNNIMGENKEVLIRQTTMLFWAHITIRNAMRSNWSPDMTCPYGLEPGDESLALPLEDIANYINGTDFDDVRQQYTPQYVQRRKDANVEMAKAIVKSIGKSRRSKPTKTDKGLVTTIVTAAVCLGLN